MTPVICDRCWYLFLMFFTIELRGYKGMAIQSTDQFTSENINKQTLEKELPVDEFTNLLRTNENDDQHIYKLPTIHIDKLSTPNKAFDYYVIPDIIYNVNVDFNDTTSEDTQAVVENYPIFHRSEHQYDDEEHEDWNSDEFDEINEEFEELEEETQARLKAEERLFYNSVLL